MPSSFGKKEVAVTKMKCLLRILGGCGFALSVLLFSRLFVCAQTLPPIVIGSPTNGEIFVAPTNIQISAAISYANGPTNVEFFANSNALGQGVLRLSSGFGGVVTLTWTNPPPGNYALTAVGTRSAGPPLTSAPVNIIVLGLAQTNLGPSIVIGSPTNGEVFIAPTNIRLSAAAGYLGAGGAPINSPTNVEFFANGDDLGKGILKISSGFSGLFYLTWTNPIPGNYSLTAVGMYDTDESVTSAPINITVEIKGTNLPQISIIFPTNGQSFVAPTNVKMTAEAFFSSNSFVPTNVEFFAGTNDLGRGVFEPTAPISALAFSLIWTNPAPGDYALTAVASGNAGRSATSAPVNIIVRGKSPPTNLPPVVRITGPANGTVFHAPIDVPMTAFASAQDQAVTSLTVEFFANSNSLGFGSLLPASALPCPSCPPRSNFFLLWSNAPAGSYELTAVATDSGGASAISAPVRVTILPSVPPPTNRPSIVSIVATDPVAVAGTNAWVWPGETNSPPTWSNWPPAAPVWHTNIGPLTASFAVSRSGPTNQDLSIAYTVGGAASNGVDYVALPGFVTIPAGERRSLITIVPIENGSPGGNKTVVLTLAPATNSPPDYLVGFPPRAAAIIIEGNESKQTAGITSGGYFDFSAMGPDGAWFYIEYSTNLGAWTPVCTNQVIDGSINFIDPDALGNQARFYRAVPLAGSPAE
jgi:hypothetical protein